MRRGGGTLTATPPPPTPSPPPTRGECDPPPRPSPPRARLTGPHPPPARKRSRPDRRRHHARMNSRARAAADPNGGHDDVLSDRAPPVVPKIVDVARLPGGGLRRLVGRRGLRMLRTRRHCLADPRP